MACDAQTLATLSAANKAAGLSRRGLAEAIAAQSAQHSGGTPFDPSQLAGLTLWMDAGKGVTLAGADVHAWADQSPTHNNFTAAGAGFPQFAVAGLNGKAAIHFDGSGYFLGAPGPGFGFTLFAVVKTDGPAEVQAIIGCNGISSLIYLGANAGADRVLDYYNGTGDTRSDSVAAYTDGVAFLAEVSNDGAATPLLYANGVNFPATLLTAPGPFALNDDNLLIGASDQPPTYFFPGFISEIVVYNTVLLAASRQKVEAYLNTKYGLGF